MTEDLVRVQHRADAVGDDEGGGPRLQVSERLLDAGLGLHVDGAGSIVKDQDGRLLHESPGKAGPLLLAAGEPTPRSPTTVS